MSNWIRRITQFEVYHGTDDTIPGVAGALTGTLISFKPDLSVCRPQTEFGQGFYVTTSEHQASQWANARWLRSPINGTRAVVLRFVLDRDRLAALDGLMFVRPTPDFWDLVEDCRNGFAPHQRSSGLKAEYDIVYGPVTIWPQRLVIQDCDQIAFHTLAAVNTLPFPTLHAIGRPTL